MSDLTSTGQKAVVRPEYAVTLKPCPFCGETPTMDAPRTKHVGNYQIICAGISCPVAPGAYGKSAEIATAYWNTRMGEPLRTSVSAEQRDAFIEGLDTAEQHYRDWGKFPTAGRHEMATDRYPVEEAR